MSLATSGGPRAAKGAISHSLRKLVKRQATPEAKTLVLSLIREHKSVSTQDLFKLAGPHTVQDGSHPREFSEPLIPSMRYLKKVVLGDLEGSGKVQKVHRKDSLSEEQTEKLRAQIAKTKGSNAKLPTSHLQSWRWQIPVPVQPKAPAEKRTPYGSEVGVGEDWSHLNKRRQRARVEKVARDVKWLKELDRARTEATEASA